MSSSATSKEFVFSKPNVGVDGGMLPHSNDMKAQSVGGPKEYQGPHFFGVPAVGSASLSFPSATRPKKVETPANSDTLSTGIKHGKFPVAGSKASPRSRQESGGPHFFGIPSDAYVTGLHYYVAPSEIVDTHNRNYGTSSAMPRHTSPMQLSIRHPRTSITPPVEHMGNNTTRKVCSNFLSHFGLVFTNR
jgi:hypothetical protein